MQACCHRSTLFLSIELINDCLAGMARSKRVTNPDINFYTNGGHSVTKCSNFANKTIPSGTQWCNDY